MANETQINKNLVSGSKSTVINKNVVANRSNVTVINQNIFSSTIDVGSVLCGKYKVKEGMQQQSGEADLYVCEYAGKEYVAKIYRRELSIKKEVAEKLKRISSPNVAPICEMGEWNGHTIEVMPYYKLGSLQGHKWTFEQLKEFIIPCLNEGLKAMHENGIIHKDLKP